MGELLDAYDVTAASAAVDSRVDAALVEAGRTIARRVDDAIENESGQDVTKALYLLPHMMNVLREMGATPAARAAMKSQAKGTAPTTAPPDELGAKRNERSWRKPASG